MIKNSHGHDFADFDAVRLAIASKQDIMDWSHGEVLKPETINYRTQKPEKDGLFCERIFGPTKDINPHDTRFKGIRSREAAVDKNGEIVTRAIVRRERMGHIKLASAVTHVWFLRGASSPISQITEMTVRNLERVTYFAAYLITDLKQQQLDQAVLALEAAYLAQQTDIKAQADIKDKADTKLPVAVQKQLEQAENQFKADQAQLASLKLHNILSETDYRALTDQQAELIEVSMGGEAILKMLESIDTDQLVADLGEKLTIARGQKRKKIIKRMRILENMKRAGIEPVNLCLQVLPVIPPDLRPMVQLPGGRFATSDLNDLYRRVINRNNRLKKLHDLKAPEIICRNEKRMLQESVDALIDNSSTRGSRATSTGSRRRPLKSLADIFKGKHGRLRRNLLGKAVDYSGRSVIIPGPRLSLDECGLPKMMALELFKPFVIGQLIEKELAHNIRAATRLIETKQKEVWDTLDRVIEGKYVLLNRAPTLHRLSIQAFKPKLIEGKAIRIHPLVCTGFGADFDGDQMAVHLPLSAKAQAETRDLIVADKNLYKPSDGSLILHLEQDLILGSYYLTYDKFTTKAKASFADLNEAIFAYDQDKIKLQTPIKINYRGQIRQTTIGRVLFNEVFPEDFAYHNQPMIKKELKSVMVKLGRSYGQAVVAEVADKLKDLLFEYASQSGISLALSEFEEIEGVDKLLKEGETTVTAIAEQYAQGFITDNERYRLVIKNWRTVNDQVLELVRDYIKRVDNSPTFFVTSGARGSDRNIKSITSTIGIMDDASGGAIEMPVNSDFLHGLPAMEYFIAARGSRKTVIDKALGTAEAGYLTRRLVFVAQDLFTIPDDDQQLDAGTSMYRVDAVEIGVSFASRIVGRFLAAGLKLAGKNLKAGQLIDDQLAQEIEVSDLEEVKIMSPLSAPHLDGVPIKSYGIDQATGQLIGQYLPIGVVAAQSVGEPSTQLKLDSIHRKEIVDLSDEVHTGLNRIEELFEARSPKGVAYMAPLAGKAKITETNSGYLVTIAAKANQSIELALEGRDAKVEDGAQVKRGQILATSIDGAFRPLLAPVEGQIMLSEGMINLKPAKAQIVELTIPDFKQLTIEDGQQVVKGLRLTNGSFNLQELLQLRGIEETQRYLLTEASKLFALQGHYVDKHLEVIIRQMFCRVQIDDPGDTDYVSRDIVSKNSIRRLNQQLQDQGKRPARFSQLLLSISKVTSTSDSFLAAASFQNTTRVLIDAAISGRVDHLKGLKENVILGQKIPVGTGVNNYHQHVDESSQLL